MDRVVLYSLPKFRSLEEEDSFFHLQEVLIRWEKRQISISEAIQVKMDYFLKWGWEERSEAIKAIQCHILNLRRSGEL